MVAQASHSGAEAGPPQVQGQPEQLETWSQMSKLAEDVTRWENTPGFNPQWREGEREVQA